MSNASNSNSRYVIEGTTSLTDFGEISEVLRSADFVQAAYAPPTHPLVEATLTAIDGPEHAQRWRLENKLFGRQQITHYLHHAVEPLLQEALDNLRQQRDHHGTVHGDLVPLVWGIARRIPAFVVGIDNVDGERMDRFVSYLSRFGHGFSASQSPDRDQLIQLALEARAGFARDFFEPSAARRRGLVEQFRAGEIDRAVLPQDLITLLLLHWNEDWDDDLLLRESTIFLSASITTSAQFFPHFVVQITDWIGAHPEQEPRLTDIEFIQRAVAESLRFFVASPARLRQATTDVTLSSGRQIAAGERVSLWFAPANRDRDEFGADAELYNPLRETGNRPQWGLAFGQGSHLCIGKPLITGVRNPSDHSRAGPGLMATLALALFNAGMVIDRSRPATKHPTSIYDEYQSLPVRFDRL